MTTPTKCCETCRFWKCERLNGLLTDWGECLAPVPKSVAVADLLMMRSLEGSDCPCHAPREGEPLTDKET